MNKAFVIIVILVAVFLVYYVYHQNQPSQLDGFAQCITDSGAKFYGAFWCPHCQNEKRLFGSAEKLLPYIECSTPDGQGQLSVQTYFTAGEKEVRAWTVRIGATAPQAAGVIHTDFEKGFIRAEVIAYDDFVQYQGEQGAKEAGRLRLEGKEYVMADGDVVHFRFNV